MGAGVKKVAATGKAAWTVMVYMAGDNNLTEEMAWGLQELKKTASSIEARRAGARTGDLSDRINVVAHFDPRGSRSRRYDFVPGEQVKEQARADGTLEDAAGMIYTRGNAPASTLQAATLADHPAPPNPVTAFVSEQVRRLPAAERYFLILSGHGSGALGDFLIDSDPRTSLSIPELGLILAAACEALGRSGKGKEPGQPVPIDILGMDSCLMSTAEVCFEIREHADYLVASEGWVANAGWPYHRVLEACRDSGKPDLDAGSVARRVAQGYSAFYQDYEIAGISTDIAVCSLAALRDGKVARSLHAVSRACTRAFDAAFVHEVAPRKEAASHANAEQVKSVLNELSQRIAELLLDAGEARTWLTRRLADGSALAAQALRQPPPPEVDFCPSQWKALRALAEAGARVELDGAHLSSSVRKHWLALREAVERPASASEALAAATVLREFDPGVLEALELVEQQERDGREKAQRARPLLQKLHQVRFADDLRDRAPGADEVEADLRLLNAVVAARWQAQSFKAGVYVDLVDFFEVVSGRLEGEKQGPAHATAELFREAQSAVEAVILMSRQTGASSQHAEGLSVYFPTQAGDYAAEYDALQFARSTGWGRLVRSYLRATRRTRWKEDERWAQTKDRVLRFERSEVDPLDANGIEARIVGVIAPPGQSSPRGRIEAELRLWLREALGETVAAAGKSVVADLAGLLGKPVAADPETLEARVAEIEKEIRARTNARVSALFNEGLEQSVLERIEPLVGARPNGQARAGVEERIRAGVEERIRAGTEERVRAGIEERVRAGIEERVRAGTEERIRAGIEERIRAGTEERVRAGVEERIRAGIEERVRTAVEEKLRVDIETRVTQGTAAFAGSGQGRGGNGLGALAERVRAGTEEKVRAGTEEKVRTGTEAKIRGDGALFVWGNPPDGFRRQGPQGKPSRNGHAAKA